MKTLFQILIHHQCLTCQQTNLATIILHGKSTLDAYQQGKITAFAHTQGQYNANCIRRHCQHCDTLYTIDIGPMELHCHPDDE